MQKSFEFQSLKAILWWLQNARSCQTFNGKLNNTHTMIDTIGDR